MSAKIDNFPLATGLSRLVAPQMEDLIAGRNPELLHQVTPTTAELLKFWFQRDYFDTRPLNFHEGQRAAILHVIYAHEVLGATRLQDLYDSVARDAMLDGGVLGEVTRERHHHPKYAAKMATGTGKTWVLNALLVWQYLNKFANPEDSRFTSNFLLVAPGLIVYDRLLDSFQGKMIEGKRDFSTSDIYEQRDLFIPENYRTQVFGFLQSSTVTKHDIGQKVTGSGIVAITNWHLLAGVEDPNFVDEDADDSITAQGEEIDSKKAASSFLPLTPGTTAGNALDALDRRFARGGPLQWLIDLPDLMVFNDEAHHIHEVKKAEEVTDVEWQKSLLEIAETKGPRFIQMDFSATPYNEVGSARNRKKQYLPHIVVDFDLTRAMKSGLVKSLALDKRKDVAALPLDFKAERDEQNRVSGLSTGQRTMLRAGLRKLQILEEQFAEIAPDKHPKLLVVCEDTTVTPHVEEFLYTEGLSHDDVLRVDSNKKGDLKTKEWETIRERLFDVDQHSQPRVIVSVLMLREGFDVNNICVIVPLRASRASILLEQTVGRGLRLMWRGNPAIDEKKQETRARIAQRLEPTNLFDVLFVVEHPAFSEFYDELIDAGVASEVDDAAEGTSATGDVISVDLRPDYAAYDFQIPIVVREPDEELQAPVLDPLSMKKSKYQLDWLLDQVGKGDRFTSHDAATGLQYGDYRVDGGVMTATGYNDYLSRMTTRISEAMARNITKSAKQYAEISRFPLMQTFRPNLTGWIDTYIRHRMFGQEFDPMANENWRVLLIEDVAHDIAGGFATQLTELEANQSSTDWLVDHRWTSEIKTIPMSLSGSVEVRKCIFPRQQFPLRSGGLEREFMEWMDKDTAVEAFIKVHEYRHDFVRRPYLKADGMPGQYSPDFLVRTDTDVYVVETKAQAALNDENVKRKKRAALDWCEKLNELPEKKRDGRMWSYVLLGEITVKEWRDKGARPIELLEFARVRPTEAATRKRLF